MRIVSQNKTYSFDFENHDIRRHAEYIYLVGNQKDITIGKYESEARAKQIFAEIHYQAEKEMRSLPELLVFTMPKE